MQQYISIVHEKIINVYLAIVYVQLVEVLVRTPTIRFPFNRLNRVASSRVGKHWMCGERRSERLWGVWAFALSMVRATMKSAYGVFRYLRVVIQCVYEILEGRQSIWRV
jgi:hypothetical protein